MITRFMRFVWIPLSLACVVILLAPVNVPLDDTVAASTNIQADTGTINPGHLLVLQFDDLAVEITQKLRLTSIDTDLKTVIHNFTGITRSISAVTVNQTFNVSWKTVQNISNIIETIPQAVGIEKAELIEPDSLGIAYPVEITGTVHVYTVSRDSLLGFILIDCLDESSTITLNPIGIFNIGEMSSTTLKEELYHWWDESRLGIFKYYVSYLFEYMVNVVKYHDLDKAYENITYEITAKAYAAW